MRVEKGARERLTHREGQKAFCEQVPFELKTGRSKPRGAGREEQPGGGSHDARALGPAPLAASIKQTEV